MRKRKAMHKTLCFAFTALAAMAASVAMCGEAIVPTKLVDLWDTNTVYTAAQVDEKVKEAGWEYAEAITNEIARAKKAEADSVAYTTSVSNKLEEAKVERAAKAEFGDVVKVVDRSYNKTYYLRSVVNGDGDHMSLDVFYGGEKGSLEVDLPVAEGGSLVVGSVAFRYSNPTDGLFFIAYTNDSPADSPIGGGAILNNSLEWVAFDDADVGVVKDVAPFSMSSLSSMAAMEKVTVYTSDGKCFTGDGAGFGFHYSGEVPDEPYVITKSDGYIYFAERNSTDNTKSGNVSKLKVDGSDIATHTVVTTETEKVKAYADGIKTALDTGKRGILDLKIYKEETVDEDGVTVTKIVPVDPADTIAKTSDLESYVKTTRTVNGKELTDDVTLTGEDVKIDSSSTAKTVKACIDEKPGKDDVILKGENEYKDFSLTEIWTKTHVVSQTGIDMYLDEIQGMLFSAERMERVGGIVQFAYVVGIDVSFTDKMNLVLWAHDTTKLDTFNDTTCKFLGYSDGPTNQVASIYNETTGELTANWAVWTFTSNPNGIVLPEGCDLIVQGVPADVAINPDEWTWSSKGLSYPKISACCSLSSAAADGKAGMFVGGRVADAEGAFIAQTLPKKTASVKSTGVDVEFGPVSVDLSSVDSAYKVNSSGIGTIIKNAAVTEAVSKAVPEAVSKARFDVMQGETLSLGDGGADGDTFGSATYCLLAKGHMPNNKRIGSVSVMAGKSVTSAAEKKLVLWSVDSTGTLDDTHCKFLAVSTNSLKQTALTLSKWEFDDVEFPSDSQLIIQGVPADVNPSSSWTWSANGNAYTVLSVKTKASTDGCVVHVEGSSSPDFAHEVRCDIELLKPLAFKEDLDKVSGGVEELSNEVDTISTDIGTLGSKVDGKVDKASLASFGDIMKVVDNTYGVTFYLVSRITGTEHLSLDIYMNGEKGTIEFDIGSSEKGRTNVGGWDFYYGGYYGLFAIHLGASSFAILDTDLNWVGSDTSVTISHLKETDIAPFALNSFKCEDALRKLTFYYDYDKNENRITGGDDVTTLAGFGIEYYMDEVKGTNTMAAYSPVIIERGGSGIKFVARDGEDTGKMGMWSVLYVDGSDVMTYNHTTNIIQNSITDGKNVAYTDVTTFDSSYATSVADVSSSSFTFTPAAFGLSQYETISSFTISTASTGVDFTGYAGLVAADDEEIILSASPKTTCSDASCAHEFFLSPSVLLETNKTYKIVFASDADFANIIEFPMSVKSGEASTRLFAGTDTTKTPLVSVKHYMSIAGAIKTLFEQKADLSIVQAMDGYVAPTKTDTLSTIDLTDDEVADVRAVSHLSYDSEALVDNRTYESAAIKGFAVINDIAEGNIFSGSTRGASARTPYDKTSTYDSAVLQKLDNSHQIIYDRGDDKSYYFSIEKSTPKLNELSSKNLLATENKTQLESVLSSWGVTSPTESAPYVTAMSLESLFFWNEKEEVCYFLELDKGYTRLVAISDKDLTLPENSLEMHQVLEEKLGTSTLPAVFAYYEKGMSNSDHSVSATGADYNIFGVRFAGAEVKMEFVLNNKSVKSARVDSSCLEISDDGFDLVIGGAAIKHFLSDCITDGKRNEVVFTITTDKGSTSVKVKAVKAR